MFEYYDMEVCGFADAKWPKWEDCHFELLLRIWWSSMGWTHRGVGIPGIVTNTRWFNPPCDETMGNAARTWVHSAHTLASQSCGSGPRWLPATSCIMKIHDLNPPDVEVQCTAWQTWGKTPSHNEPKDTWQAGQHTCVKLIKIWFLKEDAPDSIYINVLGVHAVLPCKDRCILLAGRYTMLQHWDSPTSPFLKPCAQEILRDVFVPVTLVHNQRVSKVQKSDVGSASERNSTQAWLAGFDSKQSGEGPLDYLQTHAHTLEKFFWQK